LGCFHGTKSSADDVARLIDDDTDVIVLELCTSRFADLRRQQEKLHRQAQDEGKERGYKSQQINSESWRRAITSSWPVRYGQTVSATFAKKGVATGVAALLLTGVSGLQSAMSGFQPGLEFTTALERGRQLNCDIVLADQDVDETLRKLGSIPVDVWKNMLLLHNKKSSIVHNKDENINYNSLFEESVYHLKTLTRAVFGDSGDSTVPQVRAFPVLVRNGAAVRDLVRLVIPSLVTIVVSSQIFGLIIGSAADWSFAVLADDTIAVANVFSSEHQNTISGVDDVSGSWAVHVLASSCILLSGFLSMAPIIKVILTERDAVLTEGILSACQRAGNGGRVVAVLGLLHVNGVANRIMARGETSNDDNANP
jgi:pheromone shutdown protein TraB